MRTFVDTNVLVDADENFEHVKQEPASVLLATIGPGDLVLSAQVLTSATWWPPERVDNSVDGVRGEDPFT